MSALTELPDVLAAIEERCPRVDLLLADVTAASEGYRRAVEDLRSGLHELDSRVAEAAATLDAVIDGLVDPISALPAALAEASRDLQHEADTARETLGLGMEALGEEVQRVGEGFDALEEALGGALDRMGSARQAVVTAFDGLVAWLGRTADVLAYRVAAVEVSTDRVAGALPGHWIAIAQAGKAFNAVLEGLAGAASQYTLRMGAELRNGMEGFEEHVARHVPGAIAARQRTFAEFESAVKQFGPRLEHAAADAVDATARIAETLLEAGPEPGAFAGDDVAPASAELAAQTAALAEAVAELRRTAEIVGFDWR